MAYCWGGDLENKMDDNSGWKGVVKNYNDVKAKIFKVAHHGSANGNNSEIWSKLLQNLPISILTTFNKGKKLPSENDIKRILELSNNLFIIGRQGKRNKNIERLANKTINNIIVTSISQDVGLVRYRYNLETGEEKLECFGEVKKY